ncbi:LysR family transcriptional regulator [Intestinirhabdus alba]|jgi:DNA-binding transcriptional LysR family regulator|uniref:LysR family transcriptional regulator n=1 Tax=Intestinirhabdus alba TaxID=2899544 RepID=A0A6L6IIP1_9ENTR|nr:LysR family transcriptional regulator [Intestinirhabdus alba]MTH45456.1 LysR family transcriptional regulator [Intestinirhabdus alba]
MDKIHAMQLFVRVAELESFTRAANVLGLPKGSVSRQVQLLENHLGIRLLERTTRRVRLTHDGMIYYERARDLLSNLNELDGLFQHDPASISGRLRIDMPVGVAKYLVLPRLPTFLQQYPGVELELSSSDRQVDPLREGYDCVVRIGTPTDTGLIARPLGTLTVINCASPGYLARFGHPKTPDDLASHAVVHYSLHPGARPPGFAVADTDGVRWVKTGGMLTVNNSETWRAACLAGLGIIQTPRALVREALRDGRLIEILPGDRAAPVLLSLLWPHRRSLSRRVNLFMEWLTGVIKRDIA